MTRVVNISSGHPFARFAAEALPPRGDGVQRFAVWISCGAANRFMHEHVATSAKAAIQQARAELRLFEALLSRI